MDRFHFWLEHKMFHTHKLFLKSTKTSLVHGICILDFRILLNNQVDEVAECEANYCTVPSKNQSNNHKKLKEQ